MACEKNTALSLKEGILSGEESGDEFDVLFLCGVGRDGSGEPDAPVSLCIVVASACDIEIDWGLAVVVVCLDVGLSDWVVFDVSVGADIGCCFCLRICIPEVFVHLQVENQYLVMSN